MMLLGKKRKHIPEAVFRNNHQNAPVGVLGVFGEAHLREHAQQQSRSAQRGAPPWLHRVR